MTQQLNGHGVTISSAWNWFGLNGLPRKGHEEESTAMVNMGGRVLHTHGEEGLGGSLANDCFLNGSVQSLPKTKNLQGKNVIGHDENKENAI
jgi:hypothetical protein